MVAEESLPQPPKDGITPHQLDQLVVKCDRAVRCCYKDLADNVAKVWESLGSLKAEVETAGC